MAQLRNPTPRQPMVQPRDGKLQIRLQILAVLIAILGGGCAEPKALVEFATGPLPESVYVWQRQWTPAVTQAVSARASEFERPILLGAEVVWRSGRPEVAQVQWNLAALGGRVVGVALRISPHTQGFGAGAAELRQMAVELLARARRSGLHVAELQIDYDAPTAALAEYSQWLHELRPLLAAVDLTITALPTWLASKDWPLTALACDSFVLQVHALVAPRGPNQPAQLCDPGQAQRAVLRAAEVGRPFRVALPTYSYGVAFDANGKLLGLAAEGPTPRLPPGSVWQELRPSPEQIVALLSSWRQSRPALLRGVLWFRLPVDGDRRNWAWSTLEAVRAGRVPRPRLQVSWHKGDDGTLELVMANSGDADAAIPIMVRAPLAATQLVAADAVGGYALRRAAGALEFARSGHGWLGPGQRRTLGWLRPLNSGSAPQQMAEVVLDP